MILYTTRKQRIKQGKAILLKSVNNEMELFKAIMKMIAKQFGDKCEVVLHDWSGGYDKTIVAIENGHVSGREVGDCGSNLGLEVMRDRGGKQTTFGREQSNSRV